MVGVAQLVEPRIVIPVVVGSSPIIHPIPYNSRVINQLAATEILMYELCRKYLLVN